VDVPSLNLTGSTFSHNAALGGNGGAAAGTDITAVGGGEGGAVYNAVGPRRPSVIAALTST
jgi:hypothetical protein